MMKNHHANITNKNMTQFEQIDEQANEGESSAKRTTDKYSSFVKTGGEFSANRMEGAERSILPEAFKASHASHASAEKQKAQFITSLSFRNSSL